MTRLILIRHGKTQGNLERRYVGITDEGLSPQGIENLKEEKDKGSYPKVAAVFSSPMIRCLETAAILYEGMEAQVIQDFAETDFGIFEYKNYEELKDLPVYQEWIDSNGTMSVPGAESREAFRNRITRGFGALCAACEDKGYDQIACVVHGGVIMELMALYSTRKEDYYHWQIGNGKMLAVDLIEGKLVGPVLL